MLHSPHKQGFQGFHRMHSTLACEDLLSHKHNMSCISIMPMSGAYVPWSAPSRRPAFHAHLQGVAHKDRCWPCLIYVESCIGLTGTTVVFWLHCATVFLQN
ncbi:hypothetical protein HBI56_134930 [Parastagonospora nodorum]|uniref:Uncharacterized protein n=1 Tax=Phaeosphaeria nodorum (strain SN15 / ATCC MYA-4574 / FGSC 10173) TaxID=321614 RepID=A0A7U2I5A9_PHANO|nr:hypothetical protein HBH56_038030 [Parastagonospora nodorum]QRC99897.1 hypothetical protein JI435_414220 [Parastagonospora nodorum SN15]KAH3933500.1 hypothetical protein HBH54_061430 [Parastagonospora nodorum]KAH3952750.1 hypothetical protein HBH53_048680 [Parastagonospora nodorum]KAH3979838.1 hypothetical protein HBH51_059690 [Parastagonospora nodorum]